MKILGIVLLIIGALCLLWAVGSGISQHSSDKPSPKEMGEMIGQGMALLYNKILFSIVGTALAIVGAIFTAAGEVIDRMGKPDGRISKPGIIAKPVRSSSYQTINEDFFSQ